MTERVRFITLGCKVNQYETQAMREALERRGAESAHGAGPVDYVVINTCTVTEEADRESRYWVRRARREHPAARIVVTGCYVGRNRAEVEALPEVDLILANHEKAAIADRLLAGCAAPQVQDHASFSISRTEGRARAFVKIQDGCNHACSFCKVVLVRGRSRSRALQDILEEIVRLRDSGYREIVFTGIQLGSYGLDFEPSRRYRLQDVLEQAAEVEGVERLRLSSIEPIDVRPALIEAMRRISKCVPHLHIPLQSGDDEILKRMNRRYGRSFYLELVSRLRSSLQDFSLTLDVMAGFPGEEESHFQNTLHLLEEVKPLKCHVFPYSRRPGTRAARFPDLPPGIVRDRVRRLIALADRLGRQTRRAYLGKVMPVLVEQAKMDGPSGENVLLEGLTPNYMRVCFEGNEAEIGGIVPAELRALEKDLFFGGRIQGF